ncbi:LysR family transcriptional regulator [Aquabacter spiritensis]|uniref:LysR family transcriptional regulator n=1 Tax=Aquabacter spiritensis TaxID=933073 RepID=A0A4R3LZP0_9HYPH|nr:LysR family transcriptional regulator [Aquabacter spiritensis]TCT04265.1 LysR family transcriptional regulator [Aquabacter spiritensis]
MGIRHFRGSDFMRVDFLGLEAFVAIAERGSFLRAAAYLNLSQTALSHRMRKLEEDLGVQLLARTTRQISLTAAGQDLLPKARRLMAELDGAIAALRGQAEARQERVAFGCLPTIAAYHLPRALSAFRDRHPDVAVKVFDNSASEIAALVQRGEAEFGIGIVSVHAFDLDIAPIRKEPFVLLCRSDHPFATLGAVNWSQIEGAPLIRISPQAGNRALIDDALGSRRESLNWRYEVQHVQTAASLVAEGIGLTVVPKLAMSIGGTPGLVALGLRNPSVTRSLGVITRRGHSLSEPAKLLLKLVKAQLRG